MECSVKTSAMMDASNNLPDLRLFINDELSVWCAIDQRQLLMNCEKEQQSRSNAGMWPDV